MIDDHPTPEQRRQAVAHALANAPQLLRYAVRFTRNLADAEDAYQRAMVIALERTPVVEAERFLAWLRTVIRHEALAMRGRQQREEATPDAALEQLADPTGRTPSPLARLQWRERYLIIDEALTGLTPAQRVCLMLQVAGASYRTIEELTGYSHRKVERSVLEGRAALMRLESAIGRGDACAALEPALGRVAAGCADPAERRRVEKHIRHCRPCRTALRDRRSMNDGLMTFVPVMLIAGGGHAAAPDPSITLAWFERLGAGATWRMGQVLQVAMDAPGSVAAKLGAGAAVAAIAGTAGLPLLAGHTGARTAPVRLPVAATARSLTHLAATGAASATTRPAVRLRSAATHLAARTVPAVQTSAHPPVATPPRHAPAHAVHRTTGIATTMVARRRAPGVPADVVGPRAIHLGP